MPVLSFLKNFAVLVAVIVLACGCASNKLTTGRGDVGKFILTEAARNGSHVPMPDNVPTITGQWKYFKDGNGVLIRMPPTQCDAIHSFLFATFGKPNMGPVIMPTGGTLMEYRFQPAGGGIQCVCDVQSVQVTILSPLHLNK